MKMFSLEIDSSLDEPKFFQLGQKGEEREREKERKREREKERKREREKERKREREKPPHIHHHKK